MCNLDDERSKEHYIKLIADVYPITQNYELKKVNHVELDYLPVFWYRFENKLNTQHGLGAGHLSLLYDPVSKKLKGLMHLEEEFDIDDHEAPSIMVAKEIALEFLAHYAIDLLTDIDFLWSRKMRREPIEFGHDVGFHLGSDTEKNKKTIIGSRVKFLIRSNNEFCWVVVGKDNRVINFERDIKWSNEFQCRVSPYWLDDNWLRYSGNDRLLR